MRRLISALWSRLTALAGRRRFESELDEELRYHLDEATARFVRQGLSWAAARDAANRQLGNISATKEAVREETGVRPLYDVGRDVTLAIRQGIRRPLFAVTIVLTIATCIAANSAVFSVVYAVIFAPLPFAQPDRIVRLYNSYPNAGVMRTASSVPEYFDRQAMKTLQGVALYREESNTLGTTQGSRHTFALRVTPSLFPLLQVPMFRGRGFTEHDASVGTPPVVILGYALWQSAFGGRDDIIGQTIPLDGTDFEVIGILPEAFRFPSWDAQVYTPLTFGPRNRDVRARHADSFHMLARLASGATVAQAQAEVTALNTAALASYPADLHQRITTAGYGTTVEPYLDDLTREVRAPLLLLWTGGLLVWLIGISNVATLVVLRTRQRTHELAVRAALGAGRLRLARQLIVETSVLTVIGGAIGLAGAQWALRLLTTFEVYEIPRVGDVAISGTVVWWTTGLVVLAALLAGVLPAISAVRRPAALGATSSRTHTGRSQWPLRLLVSGQIGFALILALTTGLLLSSLRQLQSVDTGFDRNNVSVAAVILPGERYPSPQARIDLLEQLLAAIRQVPGVTHAAAATQLPFSGNTTRTPLVVDAPGGATATPFGTTASADYFDALGIRLIAGRGFQPADTRISAPVAVVDETLARRLWPDGAIGRRFWPAARPGTAADALTIVGVVASIQQASLRDVDQPGAVYTPVTQAAPGFMRLVVKHHTADRAWSDVVARIQSVDRALTPFWTDTLANSVDDSLVTQRAPTQLLAIFWVIGLLLGVCGVYGVLSYEFASRRREIAVRVALGGTRRDVVSLIWRRWALLVGVGMVTGAIGAVGSARIVSSLMFRTSLADPVVVISAVLTLIAAAGVAAVGPVRQALRVDPALTLRQE